MHYTQYPYDNPDTIKTIDAVDKESASFDISAGYAYHVAVKACNASGFDCSDYSTIHKVAIPLDSTIKNHLGQEFKLIPAGKFTMGSPTSELGRQADETQHQVTLTRSFYMQTTEVTQGQWKKVMGNDNNPSNFSSCGDDCPVEDLIWLNAARFIDKLNALLPTHNYRFPTEAEWEYACRAGSTTPFYNGHSTGNINGYSPSVSEIAWYEYTDKLIIDKTRPVGKKAPNTWGLHDMSGNVFEWCSDLYGAYATKPQVNPQGPVIGTYHVMRGGVWAWPAKVVRSAYRFNVGPCVRGDTCHGFQGMRLVMDP